MNEIEEILTKNNYLFKVTEKEKDVLEITFPQKGKTKQFITVLERKEGLVYTIFSEDKAFKFEVPEYAMRTYVLFHIYRLCSVIKYDKSLVQFFSQLGERVENIPLHKPFDVNETEKEQGLVDFWNELQKEENPDLKKAKLHAEEMDILPGFLALLSLVED